MEMQMGPMIDMVFLLLVFFMVSARPVKQEADIPIGLPGQVSQEEAVEIPDEQRIEIKAGGQIVLNDLELGKPGDSELQNLIAVLERFRKSAESSGSDPLVTLAPEDSALHQRIVVDPLGDLERIEQVLVMTGFRPGTDIAPASEDAH